MCGIAGAFLQPDGAGLVRTMANRISHRGPDAAGIADMSPQNPLQLAHRRLSIIDLSSAADQPFVKDGLHLSYNGELYNYRELRSSTAEQRRPLPHGVGHGGCPRVLATVGAGALPRFSRDVRVRPV